MGFRRGRVRRDGFVNMFDPGIQSARRYSFHFHRGLCCHSNAGDILITGRAAARIGDGPWFWNPGNGRRNWDGGRPLYRRQLKGCNGRLPVELCRNGHFPSYRHNTHVDTKDEKINATAEVKMIILDAKKYDFLYLLNETVASFIILGNRSSSDGMVMSNPVF